MDSTVVWGIISALIVGIIILFIEYNYFQKRKLKVEQKMLLPEEKKIIAPIPSEKEPAPERIVSPSKGSKIEMSWPNAINAAVDSFSTLHPRGYVVVVSTQANATTAELYIAVHDTYGSSKFFSVVIDKTGEILSIKQT